MILLAFLALIAACAAVAFVNWRTGLFAFVVVGLLQDPVRKMIPGAPGYLVLATTPIWLAIAVKVLTATNRAGRLTRAYPGIAKFVQLFLVSLIPAALISATYGPGSWQLTILGAFTYLSLIISVQLGYQFARRIDELRRFIGFYCAGVAVLLTGTLLEYFDIPFPALGTEALAMEWVRHIHGTAVYMVAGFFRSPDVMGWHAAMSAMLAFTLALGVRGKERWFWLAITIWGAGLAILCGRRKMVYMLPFFVMAMIALYRVIGKRLRIAAIVSLALLSLAGVVVLYHQAEVDDTFMTYYTHDPGDVYRQVERHGFQSLLVTLRQSGIFGEGLGTASTGAHHLDVARPRIWQESGPSRLMVELGLPGFVAAVLLAFVTARSMWRLFRSRLPRESTHLTLWIGLFAAVLANGGAFLVSGQIFGDPFITTLLAVIIGAILSSIRLERSAAVLHRKKRAAPLPLVQVRLGPEGVQPSPR